MRGHIFVVALSQCAFTRVLLSVYQHANVPFERGRKQSRRFVDRGIDCIGLSALVQAL